MIRTAMYSGSASGKPTMTYVEAEQELLTFKQSRNMTNTTYFQSFKSKIEVFEHLGGEPGCGASRVEGQLSQQGIAVSVATTDQIKTAKMKAREEYLCGLLLTNSNERRYGEWLIKLEVDSISDPSVYPTKLPKAFKYLET
mmetsp:Transcript_5736/g.8800  ORF Transcript_5736/g.8800 Transcript_5736/m.8800 type:complete len:141 (+) Transcript_5736:541-963(+)